MAKNTVKAADVRAKTDKELDTRLAELRKEQFNLRFQRATGQMANTARVNHVRKEIAKIITIQNERLRGVEAKPAAKAAKTKKPAAKKSAA